MIIHAPHIPTIDFRQYEHIASEIGFNQYNNHRYGQRLISTQTIVYLPSLLQILQCTIPLSQTHPQDVVDYANSMRKQFEDFIEAFKKRIEV